MSTKNQPSQSQATISNMNSKIGTLERRMEHLQRRLDVRPTYGETPSADFDRAEISALRAAIQCMRTQQGAIGAHGVLFYRGSGSDLATDIKALVAKDEVVRLVKALS